MQTQIMAHRGASQEAPENTMPAFETAWQSGAEGIETDVQITKDGVPVLIHDEHVNRTTNGRGYVRNYTWQELAALDAGSWFNPSFKDTGIPSLKTLFNWCTLKPLYLNIELKNNTIHDNEFETLVLDLMTQYNDTNRLIVSTFNPASLERLHYINPDVHTALLISKRLKKGIVQYAQALGVSAIHIKYNLLTSALVTSAHEADLAVRVFTVNSSKRMMHCFRTGCDAIFTDVPAKALHFRNVYDDRYNNNEGT